MYTYLHSLIEGYKGLNSNVAFTFECDEAIELELEKLTPLALIVNELITNSLKHAFKDTLSPQIHLSLQEHEQLTFSYDDNGSGYEEASVTNSLGTKLINILSLVQLKGTSMIETQDHYTFSLTFSK
jgi:two-component sensor histidine kinase